MSDGSRGRRTERMGIRRLYEQMNLMQWYEEDVYQKILPILKEEFENVDVFNRRE